MNFIKRIENSKYFDFIVIILILLTSYFVMSMFTNHIGLYYDSVNPDFLGRHLLNLIKDKTNPADLIYLGQVYHGVINGYVMAFMIYITGAPSVALLHFINATYGAIICSFVYKILRKCNADKLISALISIFLSISTALLCIYLTQYYIELSGMVFLIFGINSLVNYIKEKNNKTLFFIGLFSGLACYGYYNYVFLVLPFISIIIMENIKNKKKIFDLIMIFITGFILGILPYFMGYNKLAFSTSNYKYLIWYSILILLLIWIVTSYKSYLKDNKKGKIISFVGLILIGCFSILKYAKIIILNFTNKISPNNDSIFEKIINQLDSVKGKFFGLVNGTTMEFRLVGHTVIPIKNIINYVFVLLFVVAVIISFILYKKKKENNKKILYSFITYILYLIAAFIVAVSALSEQHFVPMLFINGLVFALILTYLLKLIKKVRIYNILKVIVCLFLIFEIVLNIKANKSFVKELYYTGGVNGAYSLKINEIAYDAMDNYNRGIKELYVFEEWGIATSFTYLTNNHIPKLESFNGELTLDEIINDNIDEFQIVVITGNDELSSSFICELNEKYNYLSYSDELIYHRNGELAFHKLTINKN